MPSVSRHLAPGIALWALALWILYPVIDVGMEWLLVRRLGMSGGSAEVAGSALWIVVVLALVVHYARERVSARTERPRECACGYPLSGLRERVCPECGAPF